ncbi:glycosyltransferase family 2 protein [Dysgonomonas massiliensis]|uniref:glycosyltransferase family 2 protein n=1 Tax=Dysgonomonas massiliensis TaxID=2040292 RepID=UPI000C765967|nr:glycosyltransferase [Dysgonomonas massiliensis]
MNPKISIIIPIYNTEQYLVECIESILNQSFSDFELILVNDGSTDASGNICDLYASKDVRIKVFHQVNGGVSSARNIGLDNALGDWVCFVDADDYIKQDFLKSLIVKESDDVDIIYGSWLLCSSDKTVISEGHAFVEQKYSGNTFKNVFGETKLINFGFPWAKIFRRQIITENSIRFNLKLSLSEDRLFFYQFLYHTKGIIFVSTPQYCHRKIGGLATKVYDYKNESFRYSVINAEGYKLKEYFKMSNKEYFPFFLYHMTYIFRICSTFGAKKQKDRVLFYDQVENTFFDKAYFNWLKKEYTLIKLYKMLGIKRFLFCFGLYYIFDFYNKLLLLK